MADNPKDRDPMINPATLNQPVPAPVIRTDENTNPAVAGSKLGVTVAPPSPDGDVQTTIHRESTIHPESSILNPVRDDGSPAVEITNQVTKPELMKDPVGKPRLEPKMDARPESKSESKK